MKKYQHRSRSADTARPRRAASRDSSTSSTTREVRCACQFFQSDSLLPERTALLVASRPPSRSGGVMATSQVGDHEYEPISPPPDPVKHAQPKEAPTEMDVVEGTTIEKHKVTYSDDTERDRREGSHTSNVSERERKFLKIPLDDEVVVPGDGTEEDDIMAGKEMGDTNDDEEMTAAEFQARIEERYFTETPTTTGSRTDNEFNTSQMDSSGLEDLPLHKDARKKKKQQIENEQGDTQARGLQQRIRSQAGKLRTKLRNIKKPSFSMPEKAKFSLPERPKFNLPERPKFHMPERPKFNLPERPKFNLPERPKFSLPERPKLNFPQKPKISLPSLSSSKGKVRSVFSSTRRPLRERSTNPSSASSASSPKRKMFDFDFKTYPRMFERKLKSKNSTSTTRRAETPPPNMPFRKPGPLSERWGRKTADVRFSDDETKTGSGGSRPPLETQSSEQTEDDEFVREDQEKYDTEIRDLRRNLEQRELQDKTQEHEEPMQIEQRNEHVTSHSPADSDKEQQSSGSSSNRRRAGVIEEIDSDEFFLREKGISEEDVNVGKFLTSEIRDAFRPPEHIDKYYDDDEEEAENLAHQYRGTPEREPTKPSRTRSLQTRKKSDKSKKSSSVKDDNSHFNTFPPARPKRGLKKRGKKAKANGTVARYANISDELGPDEVWIPLHDPSENKENAETDSREKSIPPSVVITDTEGEEFREDSIDQEERGLSTSGQKYKEQWQEQPQTSEENWQDERQLSGDHWEEERQVSEDRWHANQQMPDEQWQSDRRQSEDSWYKGRRVSEDQWQDEQDLPEEQWEQERDLSEEHWNEEKPELEGRWNICNHENISEFPPPTPPKRRRRSRKETVPDSMCNGHYTKEDWLENVDLHGKSEEALALGAEPDYIIPASPDDGYLGTPPAPPKRMRRPGSRGTSLLDEDRTSRGASPLPLEKDQTAEDLPAELEVAEVIDVAYASVFKSTPTKPERSRRSKTLRPPRKKKGLSKSFNYPHFLSLPRKAPPVRPMRNYSTLGPSRPPRRERIIHHYIEQDNKSEPYIEIDDTLNSLHNEESHGSSRDLQSGDVIEKMKGRPLPPPPRPPRKSKETKEIHEEDIELDTPFETERLQETGILLKSEEEFNTEIPEEYREDSDDIMRESLFSPQQSILSYKPEEHAVGSKDVTSTFITALEQQTSLEQELEEAEEETFTTGKEARPMFVTATAQQTSLEMEPEEVSVSTQTDPLPDDERLDTEEVQDSATQAHIDKTFPKNIPQEDHDRLQLDCEERDSETAVLGRLVCRRDTTPETTIVKEERETQKQHTRHSTPPPPQVIQTIIEKHIPIQVLPDENTELELLKTHRLQVSELDVERLNVGELQAQKILVSEVEGVSMQVAELTSKSGNLVVSGLELPPGFLQELCENLPRPTTPTVESSTQTKREPVPETPPIVQSSQPVGTTEPTSQVPLQFQSVQPLQTSATVTQTTYYYTVPPQTVPPPSIPVQPLSVQPIPVQSISVQSMPGQPVSVQSVPQSSSPPEAGGETSLPQAAIPPYISSPEIVHSYLPEYSSRPGTSSTRLPSRSHHHHPVQRELESEEEMISVVPNRRRRHHVSKPVTRYSSDEEEEEYASFHSHPGRRHASRADMPAMSEVGRQLIQACHSAAMRGLHQLWDYVSPQSQEGEDRKRDLQTALCIVLVLVAMLIFMGVGSGKTYHHHHWDYFFPPQS